MPGNELLSRVKTAKFPVSLEVLGREVYIRPYTHGDTKPFLELVEEFRKNKKGTIKKLFLAQENLLNGCMLPDPTTNEKVNVLDLHRADFVQLMLELKNITKGEKSKVKFQCSNPDCSDPTTEKPHIKEFDFNFEDCKLIGTRGKNDDKFKVETKLINEDGTPGDTVLFHVLPYTFRIMFENSDIFDENAVKPNVLSKFYSSFITAIEFPDKTYENMPKSQIVEFLDLLPEKVLTPLVDYIDKQVIWHWKQTWSCPVCSHNNTSVLKDISDFFL